MSLVAALCIGICCALAVGFLTGCAPRLERRRRARAEVSTRQLWLHQAGVALTPTQFVAGSALAGLATVVLVTLVTGAPLVGLVPGLAVAALPRAYFARRRETRLREVQAAWPDGLRDLLASVAAGRSLTHALCTLATSGPEPLRDAFGLPGPITHARHGRRARDRRRGALGSDDWRIAPSTIRRCFRSTP